MMSLTGRIFEIQRFSIHDGPGIRTTVFMKGCPMRCIWCHNPEGISSKPDLSFLPEKCIGCGACFRLCRNEAHRIEERPSPDPQKAGQTLQVHVLDRTRCVVCGACTTECYAKALELAGREVTVDEVIGEVVRDRPFYETSGGGLTLSGGEPLFQIDFAEALLRRAKEEGLHCCMETCGFGEWGRLERLLPLVDLFLYDLKETDPDHHAEFTGVSNDLILRNLRALHERGATIRLRCPIIPGCNDRDEHFAGIASLAGELPNLEGVELMPYHRLGESKVGRFGFDRTGRPTPESPANGAVSGWNESLRRRLREAGAREDVLIVP
jgi:pyruvate formate lyase activating enzyme